MEISSFAEIVRDDVKKRLGGGYRVTVCKTDKNNGVVYTGLRVEQEDADISPVIYLNEHFKKYENGDATLPEITNYVADVGKRKSPSIDMRQFLKYESVAGRIVYKLINTERNRERLEDIPHIEFLDLSIAFQYMLTDDGTASIPVHNVHMKLWEVTVNDLRKAAEENTPRLMGCEFKSISDVLCEISKAKTPEAFDYDACMAGFGCYVPMYVLSNRYRIGGAACMLYPTLLPDICDQLESSFYIIPSSIHEVLIVPVENTDGSAEVRAMIKEINDTQVALEEILSYSLYYYNRKESKLLMV